MFLIGILIISSALVKLEVKLKIETHFINRL
jgi:hypothetical protein